MFLFDVSRVVQALGTGDNRERSERGRAYLEKIVQFQIKLPATLENELEALLNAELTKLKDELGLPDHWQKSLRFRELIENMIPKCVITARDIKRLIGTYHVLGSMVKGEVDWCDLLGFSALMIKAPATVTKLSQDPDLVVDNPIDSRIFLERYAQRESKPTERLAKFVPSEEANTGAAQLLPFLFPWFSSNKVSESRPAESLCYRRPLLTVLRLDLLPGAFSADDVREFLSLDADQIDRKLWQLHEDGRLASFLERLEEVYPRCTIENHERVWLGISRFLRGEDGIWPHAYSPMRDLPRRFDRLFLELCTANAQFSAKASAIIHSLLKDGDADLTSCIVMDQVFHHGLFGSSKSERSIEFMSASDTEALSSHMVDDFRKHYLSSNWIVDLKDPQPLFMILDVGVWDKVCENRLMEVLQEDKVFDTFMLLLFGGNDMVTRDFISQLMDVEKYVQRLQARLASPSLDSAHPTVQAALNKAANRW